MSTKPQPRLVSPKQGTRKRKPRRAVAAPSLSVKPQPKSAIRRPREVGDVEPYLCARPVTAKLLGGMSIATVIRLENAGKLDRVRPSGSPYGIAELDRHILRRHAPQAEFPPRTKWSAVRSPPVRHERRR